MSESIGASGSYLPKMDLNEDSKVHFEETRLKRASRTLRRTGSELGKPVTAASNNISVAARSTYYFVKDNWKLIAGVGIAWGLIIVGIGFSHPEGLICGFKATSLPISIGLGCGFALGLLTGVVSVKVAKKYEAHKRNHDPLFKAHSKQYSIAGAAFLWSRNLGLVTQAILVAISVSIAILFARSLPYPMGGIAGLVLGNYLAVKIGFYLNKLSIKEKIDELDLEVHDVEKKVESLKRKLTLLKRKKEVSKVDFQNTKREFWGAQQEIEKLEKEIAKWEKRAGARHPKTHAQQN